MQTLRLSTIISQTLITPFSGIVMILVAVIFLSALGVVMVKNAYRQAYITQHQQEKRSEQLHTQWMQLLLEEGTWGSGQRIEQVAIGQMGMKVPDAADTEILTIPATETTPTPTDNQTNAQKQRYLPASK